MRKDEFILRLQERLSDLPKSEIDKSLAYFSELIDDRIEDGMSEEEAVSSLESIDEIAQSIMIELPLATIVKARMQPQNKLTALNIVLLCISAPFWLPITAAMIIVVLALYISIWAVIASLFASIFAFAAGGLTLAVTSGFIINASMAPGLFAIGSGLIMIALGILLFFPVKALSLQLIKLTKWITIKIKGLFIRKEAA